MILDPFLELSKPRFERCHSVRELFLFVLRKPFQFILKVPDIIAYPIYVLKGPLNELLPFS